MEYKEEDYLQLSGIQHFMFCRRQWALIHVENQWEENLRTADGRVMHKNAHDPTFHTLRGDILTVRAIKIHSPKLGISGECDVVEFRRSENGVNIPFSEGKWLPYPVEYKRGAPKPQPWDEAQLCAQAMCLEEMLCCDVPLGALYYGETRHRVEVAISPELRKLVTDTVKEMHELYNKGYTPKAKRTKACNACSLNNICLPGLGKSPSVDEYMKKALNGGEE
jgi:CRISPR-associated exonuclease Cas4